MTFDSNLGDAFLGCDVEKKQYGMVFLTNKAYYRNIVMIKGSYVAKTYDAYDENKKPARLDKGNVHFCLFVSFDCILDKEPRPTRKLLREKVVPLTKVPEDVRNRIMRDDPDESSYPAVRHFRRPNADDDVYDKQFGIVYSNWAALMSDAGEFLLDVNDDPTLSFEKGSKAFISMHSILTRPENPVHMIDGQELLLLHLDKRELQTFDIEPRVLQIKSSTKSSRKVGFTGSSAEPCGQMDSLSTVGYYNGNVSAVSSTAQMHRTPAMVGEMAASFGSISSSSSAFSLPAKSFTATSSSTGYRSEGCTTRCTDGSALTDPSVNYLQSAPRRNSNTLSPAGEPFGFV
jgi:hypothetical protein